MKIFLIVIISIVIIWQIMYPDYTYRYRLTIEIDTPEGVKLGSSVIEVHVTQWAEWLRFAFGGNTTNANFKGEAVFIDLGNDKNVVAILAGGRYAGGISMTRLAQQAFFKAPRSFSPSSESAKKLTQMTGEQIELKGSLIPIMVTFQDDNLEKVRMLYVTEKYDIPTDKGLRFGERIIVDNFESTFGEGYKFKKAFITLTKDSVTKNLTKQLPSILNYFKPFLQLESHGEKVIISRIRIIKE